MLVAQKKHQYAEADKYITELQPTPAVLPKKGVMIKPIHKFQIILSILMTSSICIGILLGYTQLAELKYNINLIQKDIRELEFSIENIKVEVESVQRLDLIEQKAQAELGMQYPTKDQMVFLDLTNQEIAVYDTSGNTNPDVQKNIIVGVKETIQKLIRN